MLPVLSINASVKKCITSVKRQDTFILLGHVPMDHPTTHSLSSYFSYVWPWKDVMWHGGFTSFGAEPEALKREPCKHHCSALVFY